MEKARTKTEWFEYQSKLSDVIGEMYKIQADRKKWLQNKNLSKEAMQRIKSTIIDYDAQIIRAEEEFNSIGTWEKQVEMNRKVAKHQNVTYDAFIGMEDFIGKETVEFYVKDENGELKQLHTDISMIDAQGKKWIVLELFM